MIYDELSKYVRENDVIPEGRKYDVYLTMKQALIDIAKSDYKYLCYKIIENFLSDDNLVNLG